MSYISGYSSAQPLLSFQGLESGLNTSSIISALMSEYDAPLLNLQNQQSVDQNKITALQGISSDLQALQSAAGALSAPNALADSLSATSTDASAATATVGSGASAGSVTFTVDQLAQAETQVSSGTVASTSAIVAGSQLLIGTGGQALGITGISAGSGLTGGAHTISVTQSSAAASLTGTAAPAASTTIGSSNNTLTVNLDGTATTYTLAAGTYTASQLAAAVQTASGGTLSASIDSSGQMQVTTVQQGSAATLAITGGTAAGALGFSAPTSTAAGTDAIVSVDGTSTTVTSLNGSSPTTLSLASGTGGTVNLTVADGLTAGTMSAQMISTQGGSLASVVSAINGAGLGVSASAVQLASGGYALEVSSTTTGTAGAVTIDPAAFSASSLGQMQTVTAAQNAEISLGGAGGPQVTSMTNTMTGVLPGVSIDLASTTSSPVTINVNPDGSVVAPKVQAMVDAANKVLGDIATATAYDSTSKTAGPLNGDYSATTLADQVLSIVGQALGTSPLGVGAKAAGVGLTSTGQLTFDQSAFVAAYNSNPSQVGALFTQGGTFTPASSTYAGDVSLVTATNATQAGNYQVAITQAATQATDTGTVTFASASSAVGASDTYTVTTGGKTVNYAVSATENLSQVVSGLNSAFATAGVALSATTVTTASGTSVQILSSDYGSAQQFSVSDSGGNVLGLSSATAFTGTDVAGTINGVTATGTGQFLSAPTNDPTLAGLTLRITTPSVTGATTLGTFDYTPGLAQSLATLATTATTGPGGIVASAIAGLQSDSTSLGSQITLEQQVVNQQQAALQAEFNYLETSLAQLKAQGSTLTSGLSSGGTLTGG